MMKKTVKHLACAGAMALALAAFSPQPAFAYSEGDYHTPASEEELNYTQKALKIVAEKHNGLEESAFLRDKIQQPLVKYNPGKLWMAYGSMDDGLRKVYITDKDKLYDLGDGAYNIISGHIAITQGMVNAEMALYPGSYEPKPYRDYDVYALSSLASDYAHEAGHWYYNDEWTEKDKGQKSVTGKDMYWVETRADRFGIQRLENVPTFSIGGELMADVRIGAYAGWHGDQPTHPSPETRWYNTYNYILQISKERVSFEGDEAHTSHLIVADRHGEYWNAFAPPQFDVDMLYDEAEAEDKSIVARAEDRAYYAAGQIAWAIKNKCWDSKHVTFEDAHNYFSDLPSDIKFRAIIATADDGRWKLIDWYLSDSNYLTENQKQELSWYISGMKTSFDDAEAQ